MGFGTEILFMLVLGLLLLGPKRLPTILGHIARAKAQFEGATRSFKSQLQAELEGQHDSGEVGPSRNAAGTQ
ncbi:MAG: hypothetical protein JWN74_3480 [Acidobacteriaceae bacterium]|nr:hypothetical protein [Acidobacteriaceae bacterium]